MQNNTLNHLKDKRHNASIDSSSSSSSDIGRLNYCLLIN